MEKKIVNKLVACAVFLILLSFVAGPVHAKKVLLKVPIAFATKLPGLGETIKWLGDRTETLSGGTVKIKV